jgi:hypothetical protein
MCFHRKLLGYFVSIFEIVRLFALLLFFASASSEIDNGAMTKASARTTAVDTSNVLLVFILVNYIITIQLILGILEFHMNKFELVKTEKCSNIL